MLHFDEFGHQSMTQSRHTTPIREYTIEVSKRGTWLGICDVHWKARVSVSRRDATRTRWDVRPYELDLVLQRYKCLPSRKGKSRNCAQRRSEGWLARDAQVR
jgi:hypothetical protein